MFSHSFCPKNTLKAVYTGENIKVGEGFPQNQKQSSFGNTIFHKSSSYDARQIFLHTTQSCLKVTFSGQYMPLYCYFLILVPNTII